MAELDLTQFPGDCPGDCGNQMMQTIPDPSGKNRLAHMIDDEGSVLHGTLVHHRDGTLRGFYSCHVVQASPRRVAREMAEQQVRDAEQAAVAAKAAAEEARKERIGRMIDGGILDLTDPDVKTLLKRALGIQDPG